MLNVADINVPVLTSQPPSKVQRFKEYVKEQGVTLKTGLGFVQGNGTI